VILLDVVAYEVLIRPLYLPRSIFLLLLSISSLMNDLDLYIDTPNYYRSYNQLQLGSINYGVHHNNIHLLDLYMHFFCSYVRSHSNEML
jgi:hypothetical protein